MDHDLAGQLAETEYDRFVDALEQLDEAEWRRPTDCIGWDVKAITGHLLGMMEMVSNPEETQRQQKLAGEAAERNGVYHIDALTALQVEEHADLTPAEVVERMGAAAPGALAARFGLPAEVRDTPYPTGAPFNETWTLGYLLEVILTRDPWMHRVDVGRATGRPLVLTPEHDRAIVSDVVDEWANRHGQPFRLELTGAAGGSFERGTGGPSLSLDAVEFCRILSGRAPGDGLLAQAVPF